MPKRFHHYLIATLLVCCSPDADEGPLGSRERGAPQDVADRSEAYPAVCDLHHVPTEEDTVEMLCGTLAIQRVQELGVEAGAYSRAAAELFPNANSYTCCDYKYYEAEVRFCTECRAAKRAWVAEHQGTFVYRSNPRAGGPR
ncbi:MAG: hypothetical protein DHS20C15_34840 [Planctomycetota bacterium]|nr:MAG: hypothetical protein DHS20C15_34840 [Planctomycetota bacterium]